MYVWYNCKIKQGCYTPLKETDYDNTTHNRPTKAKTRKPKITEKENDVNHTKYSRELWLMGLGESNCHVSFFSK